MTGRKLFLLGIVVGQLTMLPRMIWLQRTPKIVATTISDLYFNHNEIQHLQIKHLHNKFHLGGDTLNIYIASELRVNQEEYDEFHDKTPIDGFYNEETNTIWCVYDPLILAHEIRHVTEEEYHR
ncbi:MAG: hypothetical protein ACREBR_05095 [bacterium]